MIPIIILAIVCVLALMVFISTIHNNLVESYTSQIEWLQDEIKTYQNIILDCEDVIERLKGGVQE